MHKHERAGARVHFKISNIYLPPSSVPDSSRYTQNLLRGRPSRDTGILKWEEVERVEYQSRGLGAGWQGGGRGRAGDVRLCPRSASALPVKGWRPLSWTLCSPPWYTRMESFPLQLTALSLDGHPSRLTLTALLDTDAKSTTAPRANSTSFTQPPKPSERQEMSTP